MMTPGKTRLRGAAVLWLAVTAGAAQAGAETRPCHQFLPGSDGCLGPGFNTPSLGHSLPFAWWQQSPAQARERLQALLAVAPAGCLLNEAALRAALAEPAAQDNPAHPPLPQIAATDACSGLRPLLLPRQPDSAQPSPARPQ